MIDKIGALTDQDYKRLYSENKILSPYFSENQIQPSSIDLTLSEECYEISASFLSIFGSVKK